MSYLRGGPHERSGLCFYVPTPTLELVCPVCGFIICSEAEGTEKVSFRARTIIGKASPLRNCWKCGGTYESGSDEFYHFWHPEEPDVVIAAPYHWLLRIDVAPHYHFSVQQGAELARLAIFGYPLLDSPPLYKDIYPHIRYRSVPSDGILPPEQIEDIKEFAQVLRSEFFDVGAFREGFSFATDKITSGRIELETRQEAIQAVMRDIG